MNRPTRILTLLVGTAWAQALLVGGLQILLDSPKITVRVLPGLALLCAGFFVAMSLVADLLVPRAGGFFVATLKTVTVVCFCICTALTVYAILSGRAASVLLPL